MNSHTVIFLIESAKRRTQIREQILCRRYTQTNMDRWRGGWVETKDDAIMYLDEFNTEHDLPEKGDIQLTFAMASASSPYIMGDTVTSLRASISPSEGSV